MFDSERNNDFIKEINISFVTFCYYVEAIITYLKSTQNKHDKSTFDIVREPVKWLILVAKCILFNWVNFNELKSTWSQTYNVNLSTFV